MNDKWLIGMRDKLATAPEDQMTEELRQKVAAWSAPPTRDEIVETRNYAAYASLSSDFVIGVFNALIDRFDRES